MQKIEKEFNQRALDGKLPPPIVDGNELKSLGFKSNKNMAKALESIYHLQIENNIQSKTKLLNIYFRSNR